MQLVKLDLGKTFRPTKVRRVDSFRAATENLNAAMKSELRDYLASWAEKNKADDRRQESNGK